MLIIQYADGRIQEGVLMRIQGDSLRIFGRDSEDVLEFRLVNGAWISEDCEPVTFQFPLAVFEAAGFTPPQEVPLTSGAQDFLPVMSVN